MSDAGGLQLLPETRKKIEISMPGQNRSLVFAFIILALVVGLYFGLLAYEQSIFANLTSIDNELANLEKSRDKQLEARILGIDKQLNVANPLISSHLFWSQAFTGIQSLVQPQVQFRSANADVLSKKMVIRAVAANYSTIARQIASFYTMDAISDIILNKVQGQSSGRLEFIMQISFDVGKLLNKIKE